MKKIYILVLIIFSINFSPTIDLFTKNIYAVRQLTMQESVMAGVWRFEGLNDYGFNQFYTIKKDGKNLGIFDAVNKNKVANGKIIEKKGKLNLELYFSKPYNIELFGVNWGDQMSGVINFGGSDKTYWRAVRVDEVWVCGNHKPVHAAKNRQEMKDLTDKEKCTGWELIH